MSVENPSFGNEPEEPVGQIIDEYIHGKFLSLLEEERIEEEKKLAKYQEEREDKKREELDKKYDNEAAKDFEWEMFQQELEEEYNNVMHELQQGAWKQDKEILEEYLKRKKILQEEKGEKYKAFQRAGIESDDEEIVSEILSERKQQGIRIKSLEEVLQKLSEKKNNE